MASDLGAVAGREPGRDRDRERQLFEILAGYFEAVEAGQAPDRSEWLARYPDWAEEIARFLDDQDRLLKLTEPLRPIGEPTSPMITCARGSGQATSPRARPVAVVRPGPSWPGRGRESRPPTWLTTAFTRGSWAATQITWPPE